MASEGVEMRICVAAIVEEETEGLTADELAARCGLQSAALEPYIRVGVVGCDASSGRFPMTTVTRLRKAIRLRRDLGVNLAAVGIVLDLLDRLEVMGLEIERLRSELSRTVEGPSLPTE